MKIQGKLISGFAIQLALVTAVAAAGLIGLAAVQDSFRSALSHGLKVEQLAVEMQKELLEARRSEKDFLLHWMDEGYEPAVKKYVDVNHEHMARLRAILAELENENAARDQGEPGNRITEDLVALKPYVTVYAEDFQAAVNLIGRSSDSLKRAAASRTLVDSKIKDFQAAAIVVEPLVADIAWSGRQDAQAEIGAAQLASRRTVMVVGGIFLAAILAGLGCAYLLGQQIKRPLQSLASAAEAVGAGDLTARALVETNDEIGTLASTFNSMTGRLRGLVDTLEERVKERNRAEAALRHSEQALRENQLLLQSIIDNSAAIIYVKDLDGRFLLVNRRLEEIFKVGQAEILGRTDYDFFPKEMADAFRLHDKEVVAAGHAMESEEVALQSDGLHTYLSIKCPLEGPDGRPYAVCGISADITERKLVEEQLRQSQKMEAIGRLAGGIAHDFNNLLTAINGYGSLALQGMEEQNPLHAFLREILKSGERAAGLTRQLLAYSRKQVIEPKVWNLNSIVSELEPMLRRLIGEDVHLTTSLASSLGLAKVDRGQVEQIILNLAVNARDAMPEGGTLKVETANANLEQASPGMHLEATPGPHVMLAVSDTGTGMSQELMAKIFEPFFTTKEVGKGTGLGLSVVYGIVKQSGGSIAVTSDPGKGSSFRIYFPVVTQAPEPTRETPLAARLESYRGDETILLVEDEELVRKFARHALEAQGYKVLEAANGKDALHVLESSPIDLVITDLVMPDMGGRALASKIRQSAPALPILYVSGYTENAVASQGIVNEGSRLLQKPFGPSELTKTIREILDA